MDKILLFAVALGKYYEFIPTFMNSARAFFCTNSHVEIRLFLDDVGGYEILDTIDDYYRPHFHWFTDFTTSLPWPLPTLLRYHILEDTIMFAHEQSFDYICYCDIDTEFIKPIEDEIKSNLTVCHHFAYPPNNEIFKRYFESNPKSTAYVDVPRSNYYLGGFWFGSVERIQHLTRTLVDRINQDLKNHIIARWHDESHLNKYLLEWPQEKSMHYQFYAPRDTGYTGMSMIDLNANKAFPERRIWHA